MDPPPDSAAPPPAPPASAATPPTSSATPPPVTPSPPLPATSAPPPPSTSEPQSQTLAPPQSQTLTPQSRPPLPMARTRSQSAYPTSGPPPTPPTSQAGTPRAGVAMGMPAHHPQRPPQSPLNLSTFGPPAAFNQPFNPLVRSTAGGGVTENSLGSNSARQIGMFGSLSSGSHIRPGGLPMQHPQRPIHSTFRSPSGHQSSSSQPRFQTPSGLPRTPAMASASSQSSFPQSSQPLQPHLVQAQGKQMHTASAPSYRPQMKSPAQRPFQLPPHHPSQSALQQQQTPSSQQHQQQQKQLQPHASQSQEHHSHFVQYRQQSLSQQQAARAHGSAAQKSNTSAMVPSGLGQPGGISPIGVTDAGESSNQILGKRSIRELVTQIDPFEKLDPEVEDVLVEIADEFVESITKFACSLAKHRKSKTLEAKDILLHVERDWNIVLPGFGGDEIKCFKKQSINDIHKERLAAVKKSMISDTGHAKNPPSGQAPTNAKSAGKAPATN